MPVRALLTAVVIGIALLAIALAWRFTGLAEIATPSRIEALLAAARGEPWAPALVLLAFLVAGFTAFPVNILFLATAAVFGPWWGVLYSAIGAFASAFLMFGIGARGKAALTRLLGPRLDWALDAIRERGVAAVITVRVVPVAPGTIVNLALGACGIRLADFALGTVLGMTPGIILVSIMGDRLVALLMDPTWGELAVLVGCALAYIGFAFGVQALVSRRRARSG
jgi:uncharacterized membrane protein YdjX (TVP38/TMEM64 family)